jgi:hydroxymethylpyrimidine pyrophosphatase-like HAD family hydrolase
MKIYVDIDGTICETEGSNYEKSSPLPRNIKKINALYDKGHYICYYTARGSRSGKDYKLLTLQQLEEWGCKFNHLKMHKPDYDLMICDKTKRIEEI